MVAYEGVVRLKGTTANAQIRALQRDFGDEIPQSFMSQNSRPFTLPNSRMAYNHTPKDVNTTMGALKSYLAASTAPISGGEQI